jgi:hypothetical protein
MDIIGRGRSERRFVESQCFRVRAGVFASAHGRPDGMPGRIIGARAKALAWAGRKWRVPWRVAGADGKKLKFEISDLRIVELENAKFEISDL